MSLMTMNDVTCCFFVSFYLQKFVVLFLDEKAYIKSENNNELQDTIVL
jgi:hypothetical protein